MEYLVVFELNEAIDNLLENGPAFFFSQTATPHVKEIPEITAVDSLHHEVDVLRALTEPVKVDTVLTVFNSIHRFEFILDVFLIFGFVAVLQPGFHDFLDYFYFISAVFPT